MKKRLLISKLLKNIKDIIMNILYFNIFIIKELHNYTIIKFYWKKKNLLL